MGGEASVREARVWKEILNKYSRGSGQFINWDKSRIFFVNMPMDRKNKIAKILGCGVGNLPSIYLGLPLGSKPLDSFWNSIIDRFSKKLAGWKGAILSQAGKCQLVKSCLQNVPLYALSLFNILSKYAEKMERIQWDFLWTGHEGRKRYPLVAWDNVCLPKCNGGLGIRKLSHVNKALLAK
jgi:hypothetical protein